MRHCGKCNYCCIWIDLDDIVPGAGNGKPCPHVTENGCGRYADRPVICQAWECLWLMMGDDLLADDERPDRIHAVFFFPASKYGIRDSRVICLSEDYIHEQVSRPPTDQQKIAISKVVAAGFPCVLEPVAPASVKTMQLMIGRARLPSRNIIARLRSYDKRNAAVQKRSGSET
jgi:hypothetical protein